MSRDPFRDQVYTEIAQHLRVHGPKDWHLIRDKYPDQLNGPKGSAEERKFYRWVQRVQGGALPSHTREAIAIAKTAIADNLPAAPPPSYIAANPPKAQGQIDFLSKMGDVWDDLELLRDKGSDLTDGKRSVKNPKLLIDSVYGRLKAMETAIRIMQEVWDLQRMERFYTEVVSVIVDMVMPENPELARAIMLRLKGMNDQQVMTVHANPIANRPGGIVAEAEFT